MRSTGIRIDSRMRSSSLFQLPPRSQAIMVDQAMLSTGLHSSG